MIFKLYGVQSLCDFCSIQFCISVRLVPGCSLFHSLVVGHVCLSVKPIQYIAVILKTFKII